jgi:hypothetical protein
MRLTDRFISSCLNYRDINTFFSVNKDYFLNDREVYTFVADYFRAYGDFPSHKVVGAHFSQTFIRETGAPKYLVEELRKGYIQYIVSDKLPTVASLIDSDIEESVNLLKDLVARANSNTFENKDKLYSEGTKERWEQYTLRKETKGVVYLSTGSEVLDAIMHGYQKTDLITIGGRSGIGKTWLLLYLMSILDEHITNSALWANPKKEILLISNEMNEQELSERMDCLNCTIPYPDFLSGMLSKAKEREYKAYLKELSKKKSNIRILYGVRSVDEIRAKIKVYNPITCFIDGSYLLEPDYRGSEFDKTTFVTRSLKGLTLDTETPIINTTQLRKNTGKKKNDNSLDSQDEFYYGSYMQDSDVAIRAYQDADLRDIFALGLEIAKGRRMKVGDTINWQMDVSAGQYNFYFPEEEGHINYKDDEIEY